MHPSRARAGRPAGLRLRGSPGPVLAAALLVLSTPAAAQSPADVQDYDDAPVVALDRLLPQSLIASGQHRVTAVRPAGGPLLAFELESEAAGRQRVVSIPLTVIRIQEALTLVQARDQFRQDTLRKADEDRGQINVRGDSMVDIVTSPLSTSAEVVGQFGRNVGQTFEEIGEFPGPEDGPAGSAGSAEAIGADPVLASHRRNIAGQLGLDVHSSNPSVQRFLTEMARARVGGRARAGITTVSLSRPPEVSVGGGAVRERIRSSVLNEELGRLFEINRNRLLEAGVADEVGAGMLGHPVLTPTHKSALTEYVAFMDGVKNRGALVEAAMDAQNEPDALGKVQVARMYAWYHESHTPLRELIPAGHMALGVDRDGALLVALAFDVLAWTPESERVFSALAEFAGRENATARTVLLTGIATERAEAALEAREFQVFQRFLFRR